jgi:hypothetical protein
MTPDHDADDFAARSDSDTTETESSCSDVEPSIASADAKRSISIPWSPPLARRRKGVVHLPASHDLDSRDRDALLTAIAKARSWIDDLINGRVQSFDEIADREQKVVRHIRFLVPLAFLSFLLSVGQFLSVVDHDMCNKTYSDAEIARCPKRSRRAGALS